MAPYTLNMNKTMFKQMRKVVSIIILLAFISTSVKSSAYAQTPAQQGMMPWMPKPGVRISLSVPYNAMTLKGMIIHPDDPFKFDFILDQGNERRSLPEIKREAEKLIRYFMATLTTPVEDLWVNLSPYEKQRIIPEKFAMTEMGRDLLSQDYILKQITSSLMYPEDPLGKKFWQRVYANSQVQLGTTNIPVNTFNKVWIVPQDAVVYVHGHSVVILRSHLKVMMEQDYMALMKHEEGNKKFSSASGASQVVREVIIPEIDKEVNEGKNFAPLRQIFQSLILAAWFKKNLKDSILNQSYSNRSTINGIDLAQKDAKEKIYRQYIRAYKKGVFNYIKEEKDPLTQEIIPRKYFAGGFGNTAQLAIKEQKTLPKGFDFAMTMTNPLEVLAVLSSDSGDHPATAATPDNYARNKRDLQILRQIAQAKNIGELNQIQESGNFPANSTLAKAINVREDELTKSPTRRTQQKRRFAFLLPELVTIAEINSPDLIKELDEFIASPDRDIRQAAETKKRIFERPLPHQRRLQQL